MPRFATFLFLVLALGAAPILAQSFNVDFGPADAVPPATYGAAGQAGVWNGFLGLHGTTEVNLVAIDGLPTSVSMTQIGGFENLTADDPATSGADAALLDDYLVTYDAVLESCLFFDGLEAGEYEVLIYAWMPLAPTVMGYTSVDQEIGFPHYEVGGPWAGQHQQLVTYSRHTATVGADGNLDMHSGIVPGASPLLGAALNGVQIRRISLFADGFESGDLSAWSSAVP
ncbi:MAG: hypothetical protein AAGD38_23915 [Acidobacteriota bacterium]